MSKIFFNRLFESNPVDEVSKLMKSIMDIMVPHLIVMTKSNRNWYSRDFKQF